MILPKKIRVFMMKWKNTILIKKPCTHIGGFFMSSGTLDFLHLASTASIRKFSFQNRTLTVPAVKIWPKIDPIDLFKILGNIGSLRFVWFFVKELPPTFPIFGENNRNFIKMTLKQDISSKLGHLPGY